MSFSEFLKNAAATWSLKSEAVSYIVPMHC